VKLADGREAQLFIPVSRRNDRTVYIRDEEGFHPVMVDENLKRSGGVGGLIYDLATRKK
jgi:hypothetical protein